MVRANFSNGYFAITPLYSEGKALITCIGKPNTLMPDGSVQIQFLAEYEDTEKQAKYVLQNMGWWRVCRILLEIIKDIVEQDKNKELFDDINKALHLDTEGDDNGNLYL
jgi:hypothetical protein